MIVPSPARDSRPSCGVRTERKEEIVSARVQVSTIPSPRGWSRRVRSVVLQSYRLSSVRGLLRDVPNTAPSSPPHGARIAPPGGYPRVECVNPSCTAWHRTSRIRRIPWHRTRRLPQRDQASTTSCAAATRAATAAGALGATARSERPPSVHELRPIVPAEMKSETFDHRQIHRREGATRRTGRSELAPTVLCRWPTPARRHSRR